MIAPLRHPRAMPRSAMLAAATILALLVAPSASSSSTSQPAPSAQARGASSLGREECRALKGFEIPATQIGMPTGGAVVQSAEMINATASGDGVVPAHCLVKGAVASNSHTTPEIRFALALPQHWNGKALMLGGGGFSGTIPPIETGAQGMPAGTPSPLARGYAVFGGDSGHRVSEDQPGKFLLDDGAYWNWIGDALKKTRDPAVAVIARAYGRKPRLSYFVGGSTGGREGLMAAGRWPRDWDGIVSLFPAREQMTQMIGGMAINRALANPGAFTTPAQRGALYAAALEQCDAMDGVRDSLISNVRACNAAFDPATAKLRGKPLRCKGSMPSDTCLTDQQLDALRQVHEPFRFAFPMESGARAFPGFNVYTSDTGVASPSPLQPFVTYLAFGSAPPANPATKEMSLAAQYGDQFVRYAIARDATINPLAINPSVPGAYAKRMSALSHLDGSDTNLDRFAARGGRILLVHGTADMIVSPRVTEQYYESLLRRMGRSRLDRMMRFYEVPGFAHGVSTTFNAQFDYLTALERWREDTVDPADGLTVIDSANVAGRTRPLCRYPSWPQYRGSGNIDTAPSFRCAR